MQGNREKFTQSVCPDITTTFGFWAYPIPKSLPSQRQHGSIHLTKCLIRPYLPRVQLNVHLCRRMQNRSDKECQDEWLLLELKLYMLMNSQDSVGLLGFFATYFCRKLQRSRAHQLLSKYNSSAQLLIDARERGV